MKACDEADSLTPSQRNAIEFLFRAFFFFETLEVINGVMRLVDVFQSDLYNAALGYYVRMTRPAILAIFLYVIVRLGVPRRGFGWILAYLVPTLFGLGLGLARGNDLFSIAADLSNVGFGLLVLTMSLRIFQLVSLEYVCAQIDKYLVWWFRPLIFSFIAFVILRAVGWIHYPGYSPANLIFALSYWAVRKQKRKAWAGFGVLLFSGRRGHLISLIVGWFSRRFFEVSLRQRIGLVLSTTVLVGVLGWAAARLLTFDDISKSGIASIEKFETFNPAKFDLTTSEGWDDYLVLATSGRWSEIRGVLNEFNSDPAILWIGKGFGATYTVKYMNPDPDNAPYPEGKHRNVHFSYMGVLFLFGYPFFFVFMFLAFFPLAVLALRGRSTPLGMMAFQVLVAQLVLSTSGFNFFQDFFLWFFVAYGLSLLSPAMVRDGWLGNSGPKMEQKAI